MDLLTERLLDCQGRVTHTLVLEIDGLVKVTIHATGHSPGVTCRIDPQTGKVLTPGVHVTESVVAAARCLQLS